MSLLRTGLVLGIVVVLLPTDPRQQSELQERFAAATHWAIGFCDRNPVTCANAEQFRASFASKAEFGGKLVYAAVMSYLTGSRAPALMPASASAGSTPTPGFTPVDPRHHTLTSSDLEPVWRGYRTADRGH